MARTKKSEDSAKEVKYEHYVKPVKILENFEEIYKLKYHLISSYEELLDFYNNKFDPNSFFAWDTETTDLNPEKGKLTDDLTEGRIVGYSFTQNGNDGYYVPLTHPDIAIGYKGLKVLYAMVSRSKLNLLYNARFDMRFLEHMTPEKYDYISEPGEKIYPFDLSKIKYFDVQCSVWLSDTNVPMPSLKKSEKHFLGWNPPTFADTMGDETNFGYIPAEQGYRYACIDALGTYHLFFKTEKYYTESGAAGKLDNEVLYPLMKLENTPIYVDHEYLKKMRVDIVKHLAELKQYLYDKIGIEYNINSGRELVAVFQQLGIDTGQRTATGIMKTDIKTIDNYLVEHNDNGSNTEYLKKLVEYKKLTKFDNSYLEKLIKVSSAEEVNKHPIRFNYFTARVPCLTENNRVLIKDKGLISIKDCKSGDYIWTQYGYKKVLWNNSHFANDIYKVTFKNGYTIEGTGHHPVLVNKTGRSTYLKYEWAGLADLKSGEHIVLNHKPCEDYNTDIEYDFARLIGFIDGDGSIATQDRVKLCYWTGESNELKEYYGNLLSKYSNSELHYDLSQEESHHAIVQAVYNTKFNTYLHSLGVRGDGVPKCILNSSPKIWLAYLQGIWDSDGNISLHNDNRKYPQVGIKLIKKQTVRDIGLMLLMLGIPNSLLDINYYKDKPNYHEQLRCRIRDHIGYVLFKNLISDYMKSNKRLKFESLNIDNNYIEYAQTTVKSIEKIEDTIVYDIEVEDVHEYIANGIVTHNTGRLASGTDGKNTFFSPINFQSLPKPHSHNYHVHKATPEQIANNEDLCGYIFNDDPNGSIGLTEGQDPHLNVRKAFHSESDDFVIVSVDMKAEELRIAANVFKEPVWINAFNTGQDIHKACYSDDTEFLTKDGWKTYDKITEDTLIAQYDNGNISYVPAGPVYYGDTGELYRFKTKYNDLLVTSNHRMLYRTSYINKEKIKLAEDLNYGQFRNAAIYDCDDLTDDFVFEDCYGDGFNINKKYADGFSLKPDTLIKFLGFYFGDGHAGIHNNTYRINLVQSCCDAKKETLQWIMNLNKEMGGFFKEYLHPATKPSKNSNVKYNSSQYYTFERSHKTFCKWIITNCIKDGIKRIPEFVFNLSLRQRKLFIDSFFKADGTKDKRVGRKGFTLYIYTKELLDDFQRLCIMSNYSTYIDYKHKQTNGIYRMSVHPNVWHNFNKANISKEVYNGKTVCYSVPSGVLVVRRNGKISICGNTAIKIFGEDKYCKEARKKAKTANFGILYGSSAYGFHHQFPDMTLEECEDFIDKFKSALPSIEASQNGAIRFGRKNGYVKTYFGRPRRVKYYFNSSNRSMQSFGKRTCMNTVVQGCAGDALKLMLVRLWKELFVPYKDKGVRWLGTIHDEINYIVPKYLLKEVVPIIMKCQTIKLPDWPVTIEPDLSIGTSFGSLIPWNIIYNDDGTVKEFIPQMDEIKEKDLHPGDPVEKDNYIPEVIEDNYDYMQ